jgi:glucosamine--fructose-6-phosphate aminotransferase (isomerizing)
MPTDTLYREICEQPSLIQKMMADERNKIQILIDGLKHNFKYVVIAARGSSDNAARYAQYLFGACNHLQVALATPSLFTLYKKPPNLSDALVIGISQSGQSPDIVSVIAEAKRQGCPTLIITNNTKSPLAQMSEAVIPLKIGSEVSTAATKSFTASLAALALVSIAMANDEIHYSEMLKVPDFIRQVIEKTLGQCEKIQRYRYINNCVVIGRGFNYSTAYEIALKIKELSQIVAEAYSPADFQHGPIAIVNKGFPILLIAPAGSVLEETRKFKKHLENLGAELIVISNIKALLQGSHFFLQIPQDLPEWISPMVTVVPGQLIARQLTIEKGLNTDHPIGLTKITETI